MNDTDNTKGPNLTYYLLLKASEFPGESSHSVKGVYMWGERLRAVHQNLSYSHKEDDDYLSEYKRIKGKMEQISRDYYPSEKYVIEAYEILHEWLGSLSRLYYRLGMMANESTRPLELNQEIVTPVTETGGEQIGR
jgi:hypothetical protein